MTETAPSRNGQHFPEEAFATLAAAERKSWWFIARNDIILWAISSRADRLRTFLEVGCGTGVVIRSLAKAMPGLALEACEFSGEGLAMARKGLPQCRFRQLDARTMADTDAYDCIGCFDVLEHIDEDERVLANFKRALRPGGYLLLTVPQHPWLWSAADDYAQHVRRYTGRELRRKVRHSGFTIEESTSFVSLLLPLMAVQRRLLRKQAYTLRDELNIHPILNATLRQVMRLEFMLVQIGMRFPWGGSILLLARKP